MQAFRSVVLKHLQLPVSSLQGQTQQLLPSISSIITRGFAGGFLDKDKVTERVIYVTKHFEKVDPAKVRQQ
jgi:NADH dehydrogenase (ubiquinone) 1 alpha/beta subcomplex 1